MKKIILLATVSVVGVCSAVTTYDLSKGSVEVAANETAVITQSGSGAVDYGITVNNGATVTLKGVNSTSYLYASLLYGNVTIILADGTQNTLKQGLAWPRNSGGRTLTIKGESLGTGRLTVNGAGDDSAIGPFRTNNSSSTFGTSLVIEGGIISATATDRAAIRADNIKITGGTITATTNRSGLNDGSHSNQPAIGPSEGGAINITGGTVTANGKLSGIGPLYASRCGKINITGGTVVASGIVGIGVTDDTYRCGDITIGAGIQKVVSKRTDTSLPAINTGSDSGSGSSFTVSSSIGICLSFTNHFP